MARRKVSKRVKVDNRLILLAASAVLVLLFVLFWPSLSAPSSEKTQQLEERTPASVPEGWKTYDIDEYGVSISAPPDWYFIKANKDYLVNAEKSYIISNLKKLEGYQDWNTGEEIRIGISFYKSVNFGEWMQNIIDDYNKDYSKDPRPFSGSRKPVPFSYESYLIRGHKATRFLVDGGKITTTRERLLVELDEDRVLEIHVSFWEDVSVEQIPIYRERIHTVVSSVTIR